MLSHGYVPKDLLLSTLVPIPKNRRKSLNNSDNYRAIALGSILGKLLDIILLRKCSNVFQTSDLQYHSRPTWLIDISPFSDKCDGYFQRCDWYFQMLLVFSDLNDIWAHLKANFVR